MTEYIARGEDVIDRAVFMADTSARFMAHDPTTSADEAFKRADSLWQVMVREFGAQQEKGQGEAGEGEDEGEGNVIRLHGS